MSKEITLQELITQLRQDISVPSEYDETPLFLIEEVEIELSVNVKKVANAKLEISLIGGVGGAQENQRGHTIKLKLKPIMSREDHINKLKQTGTWKEIEKASKEAFRKSPRSVVR